MPKVKVNDIQVYYEVKGEGYPLVDRSIDLLSHMAITGYQEALHDYH